MARKTPIKHDPAVAVFAERLRRVRLSRGMTQRELARLAHLTESYLSRLESGLIAPGIDLVARIGRALGASAAELLQEDVAPANTFTVLKDQARHLVDAVLGSDDQASLMLFNQVLALFAASIERQR
jgi:transcriptional regulator with XRE-family HTH domain